ncbi:MAG TPA: hypothetical protein VHT73_08060, partial [Thermodesulfobacteriota bacterium]|nr:hypothetical protein [Thermodesulfobacteriota bacterium]
MSHLHCNTHCRKEPSVVDICAHPTSVKFEDVSNQTLHGFNSCGSFLVIVLVSLGEHFFNHLRPVWHKKQKNKGIVPKGLHGLDKDATWGKSKAKGWIYGHGTFMLTPLGTPIVGIF